MATTYSQPGSSTLPRGRACATCRRRKTKCDGAQPVCGQCLRAKKPEDCEYTVGNEPTQNQLLEERIRLLESRIQELTTPARANSNVTLHQPYQPTPESPTTFSATMPPAINGGGSLEPSKEEASHLLDILMLYGSEFAFFLDEGRFRESLLLDLPLGHPYRPSSALTMTAYLVGMFLSRDEDLSSRQKQTLAAAAQMSAQTLSSTHPKRVMHGIQAELMLACYFFAQSRLLEGQYHLATAASTALATGVLKTSKTLNEFSDLLMPPVKDSVEERERINACWTIYYLDYGWAAALNTFPNLKCTPDALRGVNGLSVLGPVEMGKMAAHVNSSSNHRNGKKPSLHLTNGSPVVNGHGSNGVNGHSSPVVNGHGSQVVNGHTSPVMNGYHGSNGTNGFRSSTSNGFGATNGYDAPTVSNGNAGSSRHNGVNGSSGTNGVNGSSVHNGNGSSHRNGFGVPAVNGNGAPSYDGDEVTMSLSQKAEAAFWWRYATDTVQTWRSDMTYDEIASFSGKFSSTIGSIDGLLSSVMSAEQASSSPAVLKHLLLAYSFAYGAQMLLHGVLMHENEVSRVKCLTATASIFKLATSIPSYNPGYIDPLIGVLWNSAGKTLIKEASRLRSIRHNALSPTSQDEEQIHSVYNQALQIMTTARSTSPFLRKQVRELTEAYQSYVAGELLA